MGPSTAEGPVVLRSLLARTEQIDDLREVIRVLGYDAAWEPVPPGPWLGPAAETAGVRRAAVICRPGASLRAGTRPPRCSRAPPAPCAGLPRSPPPPRAAGRPAGGGPPRPPGAASPFFSGGGGGGPRAPAATCRICSTAR